MEKISLVLLAIMSAYIFVVVVCSIKVIYHKLQIRRIVKKGGYP